MAEYIDRDTVLDKLHETGGCGAQPNTWADGFDKAIDEAYRAVQSLPAADVAPVVHGKWIGDLYGYNSCSICGRELDEPEDIFPYCPYCGAKNDGTQED